MVKYSFVVGTDLAFLAAANALFNSLDYVGYQGDINLIVFKDFPKDYLLDAVLAFDFDIIVHPFDEKLYEETFGGHKANYMKRLRYGVAAEVAPLYDAVCFTDVDMFFVRNVDLFFEVASHGFMLGSAKTGKVRYGGNPSYYVDGKDPLPHKFWNDKDICCCPIFFNERFKNVFEEVYYAYTTKKGKMQASDLFAINQMILKTGAYHRLITMPCHSWVGTNEVMLKPFTRVIEKEGNLISENGDPVYSVHGKWFSQGWHNGQILHMDRVIEKYLGNKAHWTNSYRTAMKHIHRKFMHMTAGHKLNVLDYSKHLKPDIAKFLEEGVKDVGL